MNSATSDLTNLKKELHGCIHFFLDAYSREEASFGLVPDSFPMAYGRYSSIAGSGFLFVALISAVKEGVLAYEDAEGIALKSIRTASTLPKVHGWFYHFYDIDSGQPMKYSEVSTIDTALYMAGAFTAAGFFKKKKKKTVQNLHKNIDFPFFLQEYGHMFSMSLSHDGRFQGHWDRYAEQLLLYVFGAGQPDESKRMDPSIYKGFIRDHGSYKDHHFICSWTGSLFTYQYSQLFIDFRDKEDEDRVNWHKNSVEASLAAYEYACDEEGKYKSFHRLSWGLTACAKEGGYGGHYGSPPSGEGVTYNDGTVAPCAAITSIVFTPEQSLAATDYFFSRKILVGDYGLLDSYNEDTNFICPYCIAIDKGATMTAIEDFLRGSIWEYFMANEPIQLGLNRIGIRKKC